MHENWYAVILAGGKGERFWPLSTSRHPKQMLALAGGRPLLAQAVERLAGLIPPERTLIVTSADLVPACHAAVPELPAGNLIGEPCGRDTAPAVALAAALVRARRTDGVFAILTADHVIGGRDRFQATLRAGFTLAEQENRIVTIGIPPAEPSTGFGYIEAGEPFRAVDGVRFERVTRFVEKPDRATAEGYVASGRYAWNSGMFIWSVAGLAEAFRRHAPALASLTDRLAPAVGRADFADTLRRAYADSQKISIDYALLEKAEGIVMARGEFPWDDVGSWPALARHLPRDADGNALRGDTTLLDARDNIVVSDGRLTALIGVDNLIVVQAEGATLVCPRDRAQEVKKLVEQLRAGGQHGDLL